MYGALVLEVGHPAPDREQQALELFDQFFAFVGELLNAGELGAFRWYGLQDGDLTARVAIIILEGSPDQLDSVASSERFREFRYLAPSFLRSFSILRSNRPEQGGQAMSLASQAFIRWGLIDT